MKLEIDLIDDVEKYAKVRCKDVLIDEKKFNQIIEGLLVEIDELEGKLEDTKDFYNHYAQDNSCEYGY